MFFLMILKILKLPIVLGLKEIYNLIKLQQIREQINISINSLPYKNKKFHQKKIGICGVGKQYAIMKNLEELIVENGYINEKYMILKIDIEGWEWESLII